MSKKVYFNARTMRDSQTMQMNPSTHPTKSGAFIGDRSLSAGFGDTALVDRSRP